MIKLLNEYDVIGNFGDSKTLKLSKSISEIIREKLQLAASKRELIYTNDLRGIGKTYQLMKFAKIKNCAVIVNSIRSAESLRKQYNFNEIYSESELMSKNFNIRDIVVDEGVDFQKIKEDGYYEIITGFSNIYINENTNSKENNKTLNEEIVDNFKSEIRQLNQKLQKLREKNDYSMYKNIINSYRDIIKIIQELDWKFQYSEYKRQVSNDIYVKELAIWEQNSDGQIRNHQKWQIKENCKTNDIDINNITIESNKNIKAVVLPVKCGEFSNNTININILGEIPFASIDSAEKYIKELEKINMFGMVLEVNKNI